MAESVAPEIGREVAAQAFLAEALTHSIGSTSPPAPIRTAEGVAGGGHPAETVPAEVLETFQTCRPQPRPVGGPELSEDRLDGAAAGTAVAEVPQTSANTGQQPEGEHSNPERTSPVEGHPAEMAMPVDPYVDNWHDDFGAGLVDRFSSIPVENRDGDRSYPSV